MGITFRNGNLVGKCYQHLFFKIKLYFLIAMLAERFGLEFRLLLLQWSELQLKLYSPLVKNAGPDHDDVCEFLFPSCQSMLL